MELKPTNHFLNKLEGLFMETGYFLRYEKGRFNSGFCLMKNTQIAVINKYLPLEGKISSLVEIIKTIEIDLEKLSLKNVKLYRQIVEEAQI